MMRCAVGRRLRAIESHLAAATTEVATGAPVVDQSTLNMHHDPDTPLTQEEIDAFMVRSILHFSQFSCGSSIKSTHSPPPPRRRRGTWCSPACWATAPARSTRR